jgi:hypothetical protein
MSIAGIFLLLAFVAGMVAIVIWPLLQPGEKRKSDTGASALPILERLQAEHEALLITIRDLDFDYQTGKLTKEDYTAQREGLVQRGVELLQQIDAQQSNLIEEAVQARRTALVSAERSSSSARRSRRSRRTQRT